MRTMVAGAALLALAFSLTGCLPSSPDHRPDDPGIPEARADARAQLERLERRLVFSDRIEVLASGTADNCGTIRNWWFDNSDLGDRCWMRWSAVAIAHDVDDREQLIALIEEEAASTDLPFTRGALLRDYLSLYPDQRDTMPLTTGGTDGSMAFGISAQPYDAKTWYSPIYPGTLDPDAELEQPSAADLARGAADSVITLEGSIEYWRTEPLQEGYPVDDPNQENVPEGAYLKYWSYGDRYAFDLAALDPVLPTTCVDDPAVDASTVVRYDEPIARLSFSLREDAGSDDSQRIRDCLLPALQPGTTMIDFDPYVEPGSS